jgi:hypothetical protein
MVKEMSSSCYSDTETTKQIIEELTLSCGFEEKELRKFTRDVADKCPIDAKKLHQEVLRSEGNKELAIQAIERTAR